MTKTHYKNEIKSDLDRIRGATRAISLGRILQEEHPEIRDMYREGKGHREIAHELGINSTFGVTERIAESSVYYALKGHTGVFRIRAYEGLLGSLELQSLGRNHHKETNYRQIREKVGIHGLTLKKRRKNGSQGGRRSYALKRGLFSLKPEDLQENGKKSGKNAYKERRGIHALSPEERKRNALMAVKAKGQFPISEGERTYILQLYKDPRYHHRESWYKGRPSYSLISQAVEERFGVKRTQASLKHIIRRGSSK